MRTKHSLMAGFDAKVGVLNIADGSSIFSIGATSILASIYCGVDNKNIKKTLQPSEIQIVIKNEYGMTGMAENYISTSISTCVFNAVLWSRIPRAYILCYVTIEKDNGSIISCITNGICLALIDAGIPLKYTFASVSASILPNEGENDSDILIFPNLENSQSNTISIIFKNNESVCHVQTSNIPIKQFNKICARLKIAGNELLDYLKVVSKESVSKQVMKIV